MENNKSNFLIRINSIIFNEGILKVYYINNRRGKKGFFFVKEIHVEMTEWTKVTDCKSVGFL